jgi:hypothetical protein
LPDAPTAEDRSEHSDDDALCAHLMILVTAQKKPALRNEGPAF